MSILSKLLSEIKSDDKVQQLRELCFRIYKEEESSIKNIDYLPKGPNIFLSLEVPGRTEKEIAFLSLEREYSEEYIVVLFSKLQVPESTLKRQKTWKTVEGNPEKILTTYARIYKHLRGE